MTNNDVLRRVRYIFDLKNADMLALFQLAEHKISLTQLSPWLKKDDDAEYKSMPDVMLATFLNGLINQKRGKREGPQLAPESKLTNNLILRKLKIALNYTSEQMLETLQAANFRLSAHELSAFFRKTDHKHYRACKDQVLRNFLTGLQLQHRANS